jgi:hypothetical protein
MSKRLRPAGYWLLATPVFLLAGCVEQTMTIESDPPNALVYLNDQEVGRTPLTRDFTWYGDYEVHVRLEGYETLKTHQKVTAPAWNWAPIDLISTFLPFTFKDHRNFAYSLKPLDPARNETGGLISRAEDLRGDLEESDFTRVPTPRTIRPAATTRSATKP